jgi:hypothetical protein
VIARCCSRTSRSSRVIGNVRPSPFLVLPGIEPGPRRRRSRPASTPGATGPFEWSLSLSDHRRSSSRRAYGKALEPCRRVRNAATGSRQPLRDSECHRLHSGGLACQQSSPSTSPRLTSTRQSLDTAGSALTGRHLPAAREHSHLSWSESCASAPSFSLVSAGHRRLMKEGRNDCFEIAPSPSVSRIPP